MAGKKKSNRIEINALLNTFTVKEITDMFASIDEKIMSLHACSSNDFQMLNTNFKEIYRLAKNIDVNISDVITRIQQIKIDNSLDFLSEINQKNNQHFKKSTNTERELVNLLENLSNKIRSLFIPLKNHSQNLMSLKLLLTNLSFYETAESKEITDLIKAIETLEQLVIKCKTLTEKKYKELNTLRKKTKSNIAGLIQLVKIQKVTGKTISDEVKKSERMLKRFEKMLKYIPTLTKRNNDLNNSVDYIITNLQYHDIIRQKMEHIQHTHKDFLKELDVFNKNFSKQQFINEKAKQFIRIRDIAGLHAAKLLQTNKEYQHAIEIIIKNFLKINDIIIKNTEFLQNSDIQVNSTTKIVFTDNNKLTETIDKLNNKQKRISEDLNSLIKEFNNEFFNTEQLFKIENELQKLLEKNIEKLQANLGNNKNAQIYLKQISVYMNELGSDSELMLKYFSPLSKLNSDFKRVNSDFPNLKKNCICLSKINSAIDTTRNDFHAIFEKVDQNELMNKQLLDNIKQSISALKYYSYFDSAISDIINILGGINIRLKSSYSGYLESNTENLDHLKNYYTMDIEHRIHDQVLKKKSTTKKKNKRNEMDIEFF